MAQTRAFAVFLDEYAALLRKGELVAFPTETVYGLGADATSSEAVLGIYEAKGRPRFNPLIAHCGDMAMAETLADFSPLARSLADRFWPGPLTLVLPRRADSGLSELVTAGLDTVAIRIPGHALARHLVLAVGRPIAAPSANLSGRLSATTAAQVKADFGARVRVLDGGRTKAGVESTIIAVDGERVVQLRPGAVPRAEIEAFLGHAIEQAGEGAAIVSPGMLRSHYAPRARLRLDAEGPMNGEAWLGFGPGPSPAALAGSPAMNLSRAGDVREAAANLFVMLGTLDRAGAQTIAVAPIPQEGLGEAINDRLRRAAAPRD